MKQQTPRMNCAKAIKIDIVDYLKKQGYEPAKIRDNDYWYLSPLRIEETPSFKVNSLVNRWYDHGIGKGGNLIDLGVLLRNCTIADFLHSLDGNFSFHKLKLEEILPNYCPPKKAITVVSVKPLKSPTLLRYLNIRHIPIALARKYCKEIRFECSEKSYYSIGFLNDNGGYELRNPYCKNSSSPKGISTIKNNGKRVAVFEGFFDFLSFLISYPNKEELPMDFCILNSLSFLKSHFLFYKNTSWFNSF